VSPPREKRRAKLRLKLLQNQEIKKNTAFVDSIKKRSIFARAFRKVKMLLK
jgi:hypothetical protein